MRPFEIVRAAIHHRRPERLPVNFACFGSTDFGGLSLATPDSFQPETPGQDEWGCIWRQTEMHNMGQVVGQHLPARRACTEKLLPRMVPILGRGSSLSVTNSSAWPTTTGRRRPFGREEAGWNSQRMVGRPSGHFPPSRGMAADR